MSNFTKSFALKNEAQTQALGGRLAPILQVGDVLALRGDLGAGKTSLSRGVIGALTGALEVPSPTYTLVQTYDGTDFSIWHFDLYRLESETHVWELGIEDALDTGVCLIEWPERIEGLLSGDELNIHIEFEGEGRKLTLSGHEKWRERLAAL